MKEKLIANFKEKFGAEGEIKAYFAPGRVNLIGEHTDYNGGHVFPCALTIGTYACVRKREDESIRFYSLNFPESGIIETNLSDLVPNEAAGWTNYPKGVIWTFKQKGFELKSGFDVLIYGNIPTGSGLSSSASLEVLTGLFLRDIYGFSQISMVDIALMGQYAENKFCGMNCGIMDQFASAMGKKDHAIFLDTNSLEYEYAPLQLGDAKIVIVNSKVKHSLVDSAYNDRRRESESGLKELQKELSIETLGDLTEEEFEANQHLIKDPVWKKRAKHAVYENQRTIRAMEALRQGKIDEFGRLMNDAHVSLRDDYEVSCPEIDFLVDLAQKTEGVIGSRMTGGGFGGCTVNIIEENAIDNFEKTILQEYKKQIGIDAEVYITEVGDGAHVI